MNETPSKKSRPLTSEKRRLLAYLIVAKQMGCNVEQEFDHLPSDPDDSYNDLVVRVMIRAKFSSEEDDLRFNSEYGQVLKSFEQFEQNQEQCELYDWMIEHIVFPDWDDPQVIAHWNFAAFKQRQFEQQARTK